jgi:hypothetical protein
MFRLLKKYQKQVLSTFGAVLMIVWVANLGPKNYNANPNFTAVAGKLDGKVITRFDIMQARNEWATLRDLRIVDPNDPTVDRPFISVVFGDIGTQLSQVSNADEFFLLVQEARERGVAINHDEVQSFLRNNVGGMPAEGSDNRDLAEQAVFDALTVAQLQERDLDVVKITEPIRHWMIGRDYQALSLNVITFPASNFMDKVGEPTEEQIKNQYALYSDRLPGTQYGQPDNPLSFGYMLPTRISLQYIGIHAADLLQAARASETPLDWNIDAYKDYTAHRDDYDAVPVTAPATRPTSTTQPAAAQAIALQDVQADFRLHLPIVLNHLYAVRGSQMGHEVIQKISDTLNAGYGTWHDAQAATDGSTTNPSTQPASLGSDDYTSMSTLLNLATTIQTNYNGLLPIVGDIKHPQAREDLPNLAGIGRCVLVTPTQQQIPFVDYAMRDVSQGGLSVWEPSAPIVDGVGDNSSGDVYIFRISAIDPPHGEPLSDPSVRAKVIADWKLGTAYKLAEDAAKTILEDAGKHGFASAAAKAPALGGSTPVYTEPFAPITFKDQLSNPGIPPLKLNPASSYWLATSSQELITSPPAPDGRPVGLAELWPDSAVAIIQLRSATPVFTPDESGRIEARAMYDALGPERDKLVQELFSYDSTKDRLNYIPETPPKAATSTQP